MIDIKELRRLAQAATSGEWYVVRGNHIYGRKKVTDGEEEWHPLIACTDDDEVNVSFEVNAAFIAAANPAVISELLSRLDAAEKERDQFKSNWLECLTLAEEAKPIIDRQRSEIDALRAKIAEMEKQEPVGEIVAFGESLHEVSWIKGKLPPLGAKLYAIPGAQNVPKAVAYLDLGTGGYMDIGTDLTDEALAALPKGRHMLGIVGTYGVDGYVPAQPAPSVPECPYPCGWRNLLKHAIEDGAYLARSINEDEPVTENARAVTMRMVIRLRDVLMAINNAAPEAKP